MKTCSAESRGLFHFFFSFRRPSLLSFLLLLLSYFAYTVSGGVPHPAQVPSRFFPKEEHRYPSPLPFQGVGSSDVAADPLGGALFADVVRTHIPRAWAVDDDEDFANSDVEVGQ